MEKIINILMNRDGINYESARAICQETIDEMIMNPNESSEIMCDYLGLEPDYIFDLLS